MQVILFWIGLTIISIWIIVYFYFLYWFVLESDRQVSRRWLYLLAPVSIFGAGYLYLPLMFQGIITIIMLLAIIGVGLIFVFPSKWVLETNDRETLERVDERDIIFSRWRYRSGSREYEDYYSDHPELKDIDDDIRDKPRLFSPGGILYDPVKAVTGAMEFKHLHDLTGYVDGPVNESKIPIETGDLSTQLKKIVLALGAQDVGISRLYPAHVYTHVGRGKDPWGQEIKLSHTRAISFTLEMNHDVIRNAPTMDTVVETGKLYIKGAVISIVIAGLIRSRGYNARAHIEGSSYQAILPPLAEEAGLGEIGRIGVLVTPNHGPRVRLGLVTTDMALPIDNPSPFGVREFCEKCKKCADACPAGAIPKGDKISWRGTKMWRMNPQTCYRAWRIFGSDCAICVAVCPYSKPGTSIHNIVRGIIKCSNMVQYIALWADDYLYGKGSRYLKRNKLEKIR